MKITQHTIDAKGKKLGRVATEAAALLMGKNQPDFVRNKVADTKVSIINASQANISEKKLSDKTYTQFSGYPGGLKVLNMKNLISKKGFSDAFVNAIYGMLPSNRLRSKMMKNLTVSE